MAITRYDYSLHPRIHLTTEDQCLYFMEHTPGGYQQSKSNSLISNFKKPMSRLPFQDWVYKTTAINQFSKDLIACLNLGNIITIIPAATSKPREHADWDNRLDQVVEKFVTQQTNGAVCEYALDSISPLTPAHAGGSRNIDEIIQNTRWNGFIKDPSSTVLIIDDVLTSGAHFKAWKEIILRNDSRVTNVIGIFWSLHVWPETEFPEIIAWPSDIVF